MAKGDMDIERDGLIERGLGQPFAQTCRTDPAVKMRGGRIAGIAGYARIQHCEPIIMHEGMLASLKPQCFDLAQTGLWLQDEPDPT